jgi:hypothetical protein
MIIVIRIVLSFVGLGFLCWLLFSRSRPCRFSLQ